MRKSQDILRNSNVIIDLKKSLNSDYKVYVTKYINKTKELSFESVRKHLPINSIPLKPYTCGFEFTIHYDDDDASLSLIESVGEHYLKGFGLDVNQFQSDVLMVAEQLDYRNSQKHSSNNYNTTGGRYKSIIILTSEEDKALATLMGVYNE